MCLEQFRTEWWRRWKSHLRNAFLIPSTSMFLSLMAMYNPKKWYTSQFSPILPPLQIMTASLDWSSRTVICRKCYFPVTSSCEFQWYLQLEKPVVFLWMGKSLVFLVAKNLQTSRKCPDFLNCANLGQNMKLLLEWSLEDSAHNREVFTSVSCSEMASYFYRSPGNKKINILLIFVYCSPCPLQCRPQSP